MDVYFYLDQLAPLKFRVFHMLLEICKYISKFQLLSSLSRGVPNDLRKISRNALVWFPVGSTFSFHWIWIIVALAHCRWVCHHCHVCDVCCVSVANNFYTLSPLPIMGTTPSVQSPISLIVFFRRSNRAAFCQYLSSGRSAWLLITQSLLPSKKIASLLVLRCHQFLKR